MVFKRAHDRVANAVSAGGLGHEHGFDFCVVIFDRQRAGAKGGVAFAGGKEMDVVGAQIVDREVKVILWRKQALHQRVA